MKKDEVRESRQKIIDDIKSQFMFGAEFSGYDKPKDNEIKQVERFRSGGFFRKLGMVVTSPLSLRTSLKKVDKHQAIQKQADLFEQCIDKYLTAIDAEIEKQMQSFLYISDHATVKKMIEDLAGHIKESNEKYVNKLPSVFVKEIKTNLGDPNQSSMLRATTKHSLRLIKDILFVDGQSDLSSNLTTHVQNQYKDFYNNQNTVNKYKREFEMSIEGITKENLRILHRKVVLKYHPDKNPNNDTAREKFEKFTAAYQNILELVEKKPKQEQQIKSQTYSNVQPYQKQFFASEEDNKRIQKSSMSQGGKFSLTKEKTTVNKKTILAIEDVPNRQKLEPKKTDTKSSVWSKGVVKIKDTLLLGHHHFHMSPYRKNTKIINPREEMGNNEAKKPRSR